MNIDVIASNDVKTNGGGSIPPCTSLASDALPEVQTSCLTKNSYTGVSTRNVHSATNLELNEKHWYALRTTYGREKKAYDYIIAQGGTAFYPTLAVTKVIKGKRKQVEGSRLPNIFFAYGTSEEIKYFVYDNVNLPFLRFYYRLGLFFRFSLEFTAWYFLVFVGSDFGSTYPADLQRFLVSFVSML